MKEEETSSNDGVSARFLNEERGLRSATRLVCLSLSLSLLPAS